MLIGTHVPGDGDVVGEAASRDVDVVQLFLHPPQSWKVPREREDAPRLREADLRVYVHAPYPINVATPANNVRHPSRQTLSRTMRLAESIGAAGVVVHGGHVGDDDDPEVGFRNWRTTLERMESTVPLLIENTAGGENAMARRVDRIARLWDVLDGCETPFGLCLDTCHLHAAGEDLVAGLDALLAEVGAIDLVHLNDSKDEQGSGRDRHENLGAGRIAPEALVEVVARAQADVICETPGDVEAHRADLAWIRQHLA